MNCRNVYFLSRKFVSVVEPRHVYHRHLTVLWSGFDLENFRAGVSVTCATKEYDFCQMCSFAQADWVLRRGQFLNVLSDNQVNWIAGMELFRPIHFALHICH